MMWKEGWEKRNSVCCEKRENTWKFSFVCHENKTNDYNDRKCFSTAKKAPFFVGICGGSFGCWKKENSKFQTSIKLSHNNFHTFQHFPRWNLRKIFRISNRQWKLWKLWKFICNDFWGAIESVVICSCILHVQQFFIVNLIAFKWKTKIKFLGNVTDLTSNNFTWTHERKSIKKTFLG